MDILHAIVDSIADTDVPVINKAEEEIRSLDTFAFELSRREQSDLLLVISYTVVIGNSIVLLQRMRNAKQSNIRYRQWLWPKRDILLNLVEREYVSSVKRELSIAYFRDVYDHVVMMIQKLQIMNEVLTSLEATYLAKVSIEMSKASNNVNDIMKKLTVFGSVVVPGTFISGVFGMNISIPWETQGPGTTPLTAFFCIIAFVVVVAICSTIYMKKRNIL
jgi:Mg2+ and Co2+ transporter CorA